MAFEISHHIQLLCQVAAKSVAHHFWSLDHFLRQGHLNRHRGALSSKYGSILHGLDCNEVSKSLTFNPSYWLQSKLSSIQRVDYLPTGHFSISSSILSSRFITSSCCLLTSFFCLLIASTILFSSMEAARKCFSNSMRKKVRVSSALS